MEISVKKPTPFGGIKFEALIIGAAIGLTFGSIADN
jgi:H+/Cl- antiporter ClcA